MKKLWILGLALLLTIVMSGMRAEEKHNLRTELAPSQDALALDIGLHYDGSDLGSCVSTEKITALLKAVQPFADTLRFYSATGSDGNAARIAHSMGFKVIVSAWISGDDTADRAEMDALIEMANDGTICLALVGNETQLWNFCSMDTLLADIAYVREGISASVPVSTSENLSIVKASPALIAACDVLCVHCYPFWDDTDINDLISQYTQLKAVAGDKECLITETGFATEGKSNAGEEASADYFEAVRSWSLSNNVFVVYFEGCDESAKEAGIEGESGAHFGFLDENLQLKPSYAMTDFFRSKGYSSDASAPAGFTRAIQRS